MNIIPKCATIFGSVFAIIITCAASVVSTPAHATIDVNKSYSPATVYPNQTTTLIIELQNTLTAPASGVNFTDVFPAGTFIAGTPNLSNDCGGTVTPSNSGTGGQLSMSGAGIPAGDGVNPGRCTISVDVTAQAADTYVNTIDVGDVNGTVAGIPDSNTQATSATLAVIVDPIGVGITTNRDNVSGRIYLYGEDVATMTFTLSSPNPTALTDVGYLWEVAPQIMGTYVAFIPGSGGGTCGGTVSVINAGGATTTYREKTNLSLTGGTIPASGSCTVTVDFQTRAYANLLVSAVSGALNFPANIISSTEGASNTAPVNKDLSAFLGLQIKKTFDGTTNSTVNSLTGIATSTLRVNFSQRNVNPIPLDFTDAMPTSPAQMSVLSVDSNTCGGTTSTNGGTELTVSGGSVPALSSCEITATVEVTADGQYVNVIPAGATNTYAYTSTTATLTLSSGLIGVTKLKKNSRTNQGDDNVYTYKITNLSDITTGSDVTNLRIRDNFISTRPPTVYGEQYYVSNANNIATTCPAMTVEAAPGDPFFQASGISVPRGVTCDVTVQITGMAGVDFGGGSVRYDNVEIKTSVANTTEEGIVYNTPTETDKILGAELTLLHTGYNSLNVALAFLPDAVESEGLSRAQYELSFVSSSNGPQIEDIFMRDTLPAGLTVAPSPDWSSTCGGTLAAVPGTDYIEFSGGSIAGHVNDPTLGFNVTKTCTVEVMVQAPVANGSYTNLLPRDTAGTATADLEVTGRVVGGLSPFEQFVNLRDKSAVLSVRSIDLPINKEFLTTLINGGAPSRVRITFSNTDPSAVRLTNLSLTDSFIGTDLSLYSDVNATFTDSTGNSTGSCRGGSIVALAGQQTVALTGATADSGALCYLEFNVTGNVGGSHVNAIAAGDVTTNENITNAAGVVATLTIDRELNVGKGFIPSVVGAGDTSTLRIDIVNSNFAPIDYTGAGIALIDEMPAGISVASVDSNTCGGSVTISSQNGNDALVLSGGSFPAETTCTITASVSAASLGDYTNTIPPGVMITNEGGTNATSASATLSVVAPPSIAKSFSPTAIKVGGISTMSFTLSNGSAFDLTGASFTDTLTNMTIASPLEVGGTCTNITHTAVSGGSSFNLTSATIPAGGSCSVTVEVTSSTAGAHDNTTSGVDTDQTGVGAVSNTASLLVLEPPVLTKSFEPVLIQTGTVSTLTFTVTNPNGIQIQLDRFPFSFKDIFPSGMTVASPPNASSICSSGFIRNAADNGAVFAGDTGVTIENGFVPANGTCIFKVDVTASAAGTYDNVTTAIATELAGTGAPASATLTVTDTPPVLLDYSDAPSDGSASPATGTTSYGVATHIVTAGMRLGGSITDETSAVLNADDTSDDFLANSPTLTTGSTGYTLSVGDVAAGLGDGNFYAWIDFDGDGAFEASEFASSTFTGGVPDATLNWSGQTIMAAGTTYARFRLTSDILGAGDFATAASDGEVEDFAVSVEAACTTVVTTVADSGAGSLRNAIACANGDPVKDLITFNIAGGGAHTISPLTRLPAITDDGVSIDGSTQPGASCGMTRNAAGAITDRTILISLDGTSAGTDADGLSIGAVDGVTVKGLSIGNFDRYGMRADSSTNTTIICNHIGLAADGVTVAANLARGIFADSVTGADIGDATVSGMNVIGGNTNDGIFFEGTIDDVIIDTNYIGIAADGNTSVGNGRGYNGAGIAFDMKQKLKVLNQ